MINIDSEIKQTRERKASGKKMQPLKYVRTSY